MKPFSNYISVLRIILIIGSFCIIPIQLSSQKIPDFKQKLTNQLKENLESLEGLYYSRPPYDVLPIIDKRKVGSDCAKWVKNNSLSLNEIVIIKKYLNFLIGASGFSNSSQSVFETELCEALDLYDNIDLTIANGRDFSVYIANQYGITRQTFLDLCNGEYFKYNSVQCVDCETYLPSTGSNQDTAIQDSDGDGIIDSMDKCPNVKGEMSWAQTRLSLMQSIGAPFDS